MPQTGTCSTAESLCDKLEKELELFREVFNRRVKYFAALQEISDSVGSQTRVCERTR